MHQSNRVRRDLSFVFQCTGFNLTTTTISRRTSASSSTTNFLSSVSSFLSKATDHSSVFSSRSTFAQFSIRTATGDRSTLFAFHRSDPHTRDLTSFVDRRSTTNREARSNLSILILRAFYRFLTRLFHVFQVLRGIRFFGMRQTIRTQHRRRVAFRGNFHFCWWLSCFFFYRRS